MIVEKLKNKGVALLNCPSNEGIPTCKTIVVIGCARGGTSAVAGILNHMGLEMYGAHAPNFEDIRLGSLLESNKTNEFEQCIKEYNERSETWAWKRPSAIKHLGYITKNIRNPYFICVFRDVFSIANRNKISMGSGILHSMENALAEYQELLLFLKSNKQPTMLCSSEKIIRYPENFIDMLSDFIGLVPTTEQRAQALEFLDPEPELYLEVSRINRGQGQISSINNGIVYGWASWNYKKESVWVVASLNDNIITKVNAEDFRQSLEGNVSARNGYCGFEIDLKEYHCKPGDVLTIKIDGEVRELKNSQWTLEADNL